MSQIRDASFVEHSSFSRLRTSSTRPLPDLLLYASLLPSPLTFRSETVPTAMARFTLPKHARLHRMSKFLSACPILFPLADSRIQNTIHRAVFRVIRRRPCTHPQRNLGDLRRDPRDARVPRLYAPHPQ